MSEDGYAARPVLPALRGYAMRPLTSSMLFAPLKRSLGGGQSSAPRHWQATSAAVGCSLYSPGQRG
eukprot:2383530-Lingulodinium_polyedra.AAC.2